MERLSVDNLFEVLLFVPQIQNFRLVNKLVKELVERRVPLVANLAPVTQDNAPKLKKFLEIFTKIGGLVITLYEEPVLNLKKLRDRLDFCYEKHTHGWEIRALKSRLIDKTRNPIDRSKFLEWMNEIVVKKHPELKHLEIISSRYLITSDRSRVFHLKELLRLNLQKTRIEYLDFTFEKFTRTTEFVEKVKSYFIELKHLKHLKVSFYHEQENEERGKDYVYSHHVFKVILDSLIINNTLKSLHLSNYSHQMEEDVRKLVRGKSIEILSFSHVHTTPTGMLFHDITKNSNVHTLEIPFTCAGNEYGSYGDINRNSFIQLLDFNGSLCLSGGIGYKEIKGFWSRFTEPKWTALYIDHTMITTKTVTNEVFSGACRAIHLRHLRISYFTRSYHWSNRQKPMPLSHIISGISSLRNHPNLRTVSIVIDKERYYARELNELIKYVADVILSMKNINRFLILSSEPPNDSHKKITKIQLNGEIAIWMNYLVERWRVKFQENGFEECKIDILDRNCRMTLRSWYDYFRSIKSNQNPSFDTGRNRVKEGDGRKRIRKNY